MGVVNRLAGVGADVEDEPVAALPNALFASHSVSGSEDPVQQAILGDLAGVGQVLARYHQHVDGRPRCHVLESDDLVVLEDDPRRRSTGGYLAEDAM
jgi:hypothetical protein